MAIVTRWAHTTDPGESPAAPIIPQTRMDSRWGDQDSDFCGPAEYGKLEVDMRLRVDCLRYIM